MTKPLVKKKAQFEVLTFNGRGIFIFDALHGKICIKYCVWDAINLFFTDKETEAQKS